MAFLKATLLIAALQVRVLIKSIRFLICALVALVPAGIALAAGGVTDAEKTGAGLSIMLLAFAAPLVGLILGSVVIAEEVEGRTITYFFTRPLHRSALFLGRWAAVALVGSVLMAVSAATVSYGSSHATFRTLQPELHWELQAERSTGWKTIQTGSRAVVRYQDEDRDNRRKHVSHLKPGEIIELPMDYRERPQRIVATEWKPRDLDLPEGFTGLLILSGSLGAAIYTIITAGLSIFVKRPMILGLAYAFAVEGLLANLPGSTQALSVQFYLRSILVDPESPMWNRWIPMGSEFLEPSQAILRLSVFGLILLIGCSRAVVRKQFLLTS